MLNQGVGNKTDTSISVFTWLYRMLINANKTQVLGHEGLRKAGLIRLLYCRTSQHLEPGNVHCDFPRRRRISQLYLITEYFFSQASPCTTVPRNRFGEMFI